MKGRLSREALEGEVLQGVDLDEANFYFCGPKMFMKSVRQILREMGVAEEKIHFEFFGPIPEY